MPRTPRSLLFCLAPLALALCTPALAGTMFRCGSSYQDRPCDAGQPAKVINSSGVARERVSAPAHAPVSAPVATAVAATRVDAECAARGNRAKQIVWAKESGRTAEVQLADARTEDARRLISDVYARSGSSVDIRRDVEADCMAAKAGPSAPSGLANICQVLKTQMDAADQADPNNRQRQAAAKAWRDAGC